MINREDLGYHFEDLIDHYEDHGDHDGVLDEDHDDDDGVFGDDDDTGRWPLQLVSQLGFLEGSKT